MADASFSALGGQARRTLVPRRMARRSAPAQSRSRRGADVAGALRAPSGGRGGVQGVGLGQVAGPGDERGLSGTGLGALDVREATGPSAGADRGGPERRRGPRPKGCLKAIKPARRSVCNAPLALGGTLVVTMLSHPAPNPFARPSS